MSEFLTQFHFLRPAWLLALIPALLVLSLVWLRFKRSSQWDALIDAPLLKHLLDGRQVKQRRLPLLGIGLLWCVACVALAGPAWQQLPQPVQQNAEAMVICWDLSPSMLAEDIKPSRLERARLKLIDLLKSRRDGLTALIAYSGEAYTVAPLTDDTNTLVNLLPALTPTTLPTVGSNPEMALEQAIDLLKAAGVQDGSVVMLTDGVAEDAFPILDSMAAGSPYNVVYWGIGTAEGAPIRLPQGGFAKQNDGSIVVAKLNEAEIQNFAARSGQFYIPVAANDSDIEAIKNLFFSDTQQTIETDRLFDQWFEHGQYLALLLLPFLVLLFRRGWVFTLLLMLPLTMIPKPAEAFSWDSLWRNQDQRAQSALESGEETAPTQFSSPALQGQAYSELGQHEAAAEAFALGESAEHDYNAGTALTRAGAYEEAIAAFDRALEKQPDFEAAQKNKSIAEELAKLQQQQQQQNQQSQDGESDQSENQPSDDQQNADNQQSQNQPSENPSSENQQSEYQQAQNQEGTENQDKENPYSQAADEAEQAEDEAQKNEQQQAREEQLDNEEDNATDEEAEQQLARMQQAATEQSEEQQKLEQWLRKVPDDPSGLMREKFKHQYLERKRTFNRQANEAEKRW